MGVIMNLATIERDNDCLYLVQDLNGLGIYERAKAIVTFCDKETKDFEREIDRAILKIFEKYDINIPNKDKSVLKLAFDLLKAKKKEIVITDLYENVQDCELIAKTKNHFTVMLESDRFIQCGVKVEERDL